MSDGRMFLNERELATRWGVAPGSLANERSAGRGCPFVRIGSRVRYRLSDVEQFEERGFVRTRTA